MEKKKIDSPLIFFAVLTLLFMSLILVVFGIMKGKGGAPFEVKTDGEKTTNQKDLSVGKYFDNSSSLDLDEETFLKEDPFKETCSEVSGDGLSSVVSNTVCIR